MMMGSIFAMAGGVLLQPFLPMRPKQRPLNGLLYALPQTTIPPDWMYDEMIRSRAAGASTSFASSCSYADPLALSDFITFGFLLSVFRTDEELCQAGRLIR
jgi:hypothetical protein